MNINETAKFCRISRQMYHAIKAGKRDISKPLAGFLSVKTGVPAEVIRNLSPEEFAAFVDRQTLVAAIYELAAQADIYFVALDETNGRLVKLLDEYSRPAL